ncbi:pilin [Stenotrophomonas ginsengisoli]|uniref:Pilin n=1 Tax=Stenotrophomonas ginsengisoli TaxID=336566 RepID=A0A0R0D3X4_9GAMM|nr:Flp family type IVb pilin [Stenotrophomonas ginsengisoli]KRG76799.1 pilin [Stenotrophomonas ginsengisoli]
MNIIKATKRFLHEEDGVTALEYGLLAAVVAGALVVIAGPALRTFFTNLFDQLNDVLSNAFS